VEADGTVARAQLVTGLTAHKGVMQTLQRLAHTRKYKSIGVEIKGCIGAVDRAMVIRTDEHEIS
jgi:hypothetical protein